MMGWQSTEERVKQFMQIPPEIKLAWLRQMQEFAAQDKPELRRKVRDAINRIKK